MTGYGDQGVSSEDGCRAPLLRKPFSLEQLRGALAEVADDGDGGGPEASRAPRFSGKARPP